MKSGRDEKTKMENTQVSDLQAIEQLMVSSLQPVNPRPEFVEGLHQRLIDPMSQQCDLRGDIHLNLSYSSWQRY